MQETKNFKKATGTLKATQLHSSLGFFTDA